MNTLTQSHPVRPKQICDNCLLGHASHCEQSNCTCICNDKAVDEIPPEPFRLTPLEMRACLLLLDGLSLKEISERLGLGVQPNKNRFGTIYKKFGIKGGGNRVKLAMMLSQIAPTDIRGGTSEQAS